MWRYRAARWLRLLSALALLALALALFSAVLGEVLAPWLGGGLGRASDLLPEALRPGGGSPRGFMITARPEPAGALLWVDGSERGRTPLVANVRCREGEEVELRLTAEGRAPWVQKVPCRPGGSLLIKPRL